MHRKSLAARPSIHRILGWEDKDHEDPASDQLSVTVGAGLDSTLSGPHLRATEKIRAVSRSCVCTLVTDRTSRSATVSSVHTRRR